MWGPPPPRPPRRGPAETQGTHGVRSAGEQQQRRRQQRVGTHGAPRCPRGRLDGGPAVRTPGPGGSAASAGSRAPAGSRGRRSHGRATHAAASPGTAAPRKRWQCTKPPSPLIRTPRRPRALLHPARTGREPARGPAGVGAEGGRAGPAAGSRRLSPGAEEAGREHAGLAFDAATLPSPSTLEVLGRPRGHLAVTVLSLAANETHLRGAGGLGERRLCQGSADAAQRGLRRCLLHLLGGTATWHFISAFH